MIGDLRFNYRCTANHRSTKTQLVSMKFICRNGTTGFFNEGSSFSLKIGARKQSARPKCWMSRVEQVVSCVTGFIGVGE